MEGKLIYEVCGKGFSRQSSLNRHSEIQEIQQGTKSLEFNCEMCLTKLNRNLFPSGQLRPPSPTRTFTDPLQNSDVDYDQEDYVRDTPRRSLRLRGVSTNWTTHDALGGSEGKGEEERRLRNYARKHFHSSH